MYMTNYDTLVVNKETLQSLTKEIEVKDGELRIIRAENACFREQIIDYESRLGTTRKYEIELIKQTERVEELEHSLYISEQRYNALLTKMDAGILKIQMTLENTAAAKLRKLLTTIKNLLLGNPIKSSL